MRKNFLLTVATTVSVLLIGAMVAQAASIQWGGRLTPRFEVNERSDFNDDTSSNYFVQQRIRLQAKADILPDTSAFIQLQSVQTWGEADTNGGALGGGNSSFTANDLDATVGVHQAYFVLKNFAGLPADLKMGRQEVVLDGHRLFGNTLWTMGMQSHDGIRLNHHEGNHTVSLMYLRANEGAGGAPTDADHIDVYVAWANMQGILGGGLSLYFVAFDDECDASAAGVCSAGPTDNNLYTVGGRQAGQLFGIDYRGEFYYQFGGAEAAAASVAGTSYAATGPGSGIDRGAYMFGVRLGKKFNNVMWKPSLTLWYDYLSGTSEEDARDGDFATFNTLFDTGHKFYGLMDMFLNAGGANTNFLGLVDYAVKASISPAKNWKFKAAWHQFHTAESPNVNAGIAAQNGNRFGSSDLGQEIDLTLVHKYNANTTISAGWSHYAATPLFHVVATGAGTGGGGNDNADWAYLQFDVRF
jgi:hypothetical protein